MSKAYSYLLQAYFYTCGFLFTIGDSVAQVTSDNTLNTKVNNDGNVAEITGGETRGSNLFHSFQNFSVIPNNEAYFNNADNINNIFSRVTGGNVSNIDGLIRANGTASLFLINPAGIIFGEGARLDLGGSFYGSTASSILFEEGEFSAANLEANPLLTVNAPIGLGFRDNPGDIVNRADFGLSEQTLEQIRDQQPITVNRITNITGLEVNPGQNLALIGGDVLLDRSGLTAPGGNVTLGGLSQAGEVAFDDGSFVFPDDVNKADLSLSDNALVKVVGAGGGYINVEVNNLSLIEQSQIVAGIAEGSGNINTIAGDIVVNAEESVTLIDSGEFEEPRIDLHTAILNTVGLPPTTIENSKNQDETNTAGSSGSISIDTQRLNVTERSLIGTRLYGVGNTKDININADTVLIDQGTISSQVGLFTNKGRGNSGDINITSNNFEATNNSFIITDNDGVGAGDAGDINISATDSIKIGEPYTGFISEIGKKAVGNAGDINFTANSASLDNAVGLLTQVRGSGNAGSIKLDIANSLVINGADLQAQVLQGGAGQGGNITINTSTLELLPGSQLLSDSRSIGDSGDIIVQADESVYLSASAIATGTVEGTKGSTGKIEIVSPRVFLTDKAIISSSPAGEGQTADINIDAETISLDNFSLISASSRTNLSQEPGNITLNSDRLTVKNGSIINATTSSKFDGGQININSQVLEIFSGGALQTATDSDGNAGNINLNVSDGIVLDGNNAPNQTPEFDFDEDLLDNLAGRTGIFANTNNGTSSSGGNIQIDSNFIIALPNGNSDIVANAQQGQGGNITIDAEFVFGIEERPLNSLTNDINAASEVEGLDGSVEINSLNIDPTQGTIELPTNVVEPGETTAQICNANREVAAINSFTIRGRGGIPSSPDLPLDSAKIIVDDNSYTSFLPKTLETDQDKIQPAQGIEVGDRGEVILTAYRTDSQGDRQAKINHNCQVKGKD